MTVNINALYVQQKLFKWKSVRYIYIIRTNDLWKWIKYDENYLITFELQEANCVLIFSQLLNDWTAVLTTNKVTKKYQIINNKLMAVN